jgi:hypothetical protein
VANLLIADDTVTIELTMAEKAETLHGKLTVPRSAITDIRVVPDGLAEVHGFKLAGSGIPGVIEAGTFSGAQGRTFAAAAGSLSRFARPRRRPVLRRSRSSRQHRTVGMKQARACLHLIGRGQQLPGASIAIGVCRYDLAEQTS